MIEVRKSYGKTGAKSDARTETLNVEVAEKAEFEPWLSALRV